LRHRSRKNQHATRETEELVEEQEKLATELDHIEEQEKLATELDHIENLGPAAEAQLEQTFEAAYGVRKAPTANRN
jgi:SMC interacting uncharacterized protein involved in chromosome segregation